MRWKSIGSMTVAVCALLVAVGVAQGDEPGGNGQPPWVTLVACLNAHGVQTPTTNDPVQLKTWLGERLESDPAVKAALEACAPDANKEGGGGAEPSVADLIACLRSHRVQPPDTTDPLTLKTWLGQHYESDPAVEAALRACNPPEQKQTGNAPSL